jgi:membrane protease YdiL (CAAX protease family)
MTLKYQCNACGQLLYTASLKPGDTIICHKCGATMRITNETETDNCTPGAITQIKDNDSPDRQQSESSAVGIPKTAELPDQIPSGQDKIFPGFWQAIGLLGIFLACVIILFIPLLIISSISNTKLYQNFVIEEIVTAMGFAIVFYIALKKTRLSFKKLFPFDQINTLLVVPITLTIIGATITLSEIDNLFRLVYPMPEFIESIFRQLYENFWYFLIGGVIIAPVTEEMLFRGLILRGFLNRYTKVKAIIVSSLLFGIIHLNPWQFISAFMMGLLLAWLFIQTRSLIPCVLGHALANGISFIASFVDIKIQGFQYNPDYPRALQPLWFDLLGIALLILGLWLFKNMIAKYPPKISS